MLQNCNPDLSESVIQVTEKYWFGLLTHTICSCTLCSMTTNTQRRITLFINPLLAKQARAQAVVEDLTLTKLVEMALISYLPKVTTIKKINIST